MGVITLVVHHTTLAFKWQVVCCCRDTFIAASISIEYMTIYMYVILAWYITIHDFDSLMQDCSNSIANALELLQSSNKPSIYESITELDN